MKTASTDQKVINSFFVALKCLTGEIHVIIIVDNYINDTQRTSGLQWNYPLFMDSP